ncbi:MAG: Snf7 family protein [Kiritimatiellae bacterium]|nr:Snf7 family protein [Kiritimatiellia bacterium]
MGFLFFKTAKEKEREARREKRHALRRAEGAVDETDERIKRMEKEAEADWQRAKDAAKEGRQAAAQRALTSYRAAQVLITKLEQKKWVFKQVLMKLETAGTDADFAKALGMVNKVTNINVDMVEDVFDEAGDLLAEAGDTDKFWAQMYGKEVEGSKSALQDHIPSMEDLEKNLQEEVAGKIAGAPSAADLEKEL